MLYRYSQSLRLAVMVKNLTGFHLKKKDYSFELPRDITLALSKKWKNHTFSLDNEIITGRFGDPVKQNANIWLIRAGLESEYFRRLRLRAGLIYPVLARTSDLGDLLDDIPQPRLGPTAGLGFSGKRFNFDLAFYGDFANTYIKRRPALGLTGTIIYKFNGPFKKLTEKQQ